MSDFTSGCCDVPGANCSREALFAARLRSILKLMGCQFPSLFQTVDFWRPAVVTPTFDACGNETFPDEEQEVWVRLGESIAAFVFEKEEKFFQAGEGVVRMRVTWVYVPEGMDIRGDDHVIIGGFAYMVTESIEQAGVCKLKVEKAKSRFQRPARTDPTYRQFEIKAAIQ